MKMKLEVAALSLLFLGACDQSKADLEMTKQQLAQVTAERDTLKTQVDSLKQQLDAAKAAAAAAAPPVAPPTAPPVATAPPAHHHAAPPPPVPGVAPTTKAGIEQQKKIEQTQDKGKAHFNR